MKIFELKLKNEGVTLNVYLPDASKEMPRMAVRPGVLVIPGGGYSFCSDREAEPVALAFAAKGYAAFVLRYSIGKDKDFSMPFADAEEAMEIIHDNAAEWGVNKEKIAAIGFSAGGHLCAALSTMGKIRPNASILIYPCILESIGKILAFPVPSLEKEVDEKTPATFIAAVREDGVVPIKNSIAYAAALEEAGVPFEIHIFEKGYHGYSLADHTVYSKAEEEYNAHLKCWVDLCMNWLCKRFEV
ncbi:MAG: alpha/beta hydrolase [Ruminococcaceae bacterium]|nr:alpha/beta hydrolase [Oscillospiraceae bacterium]